MRWDYEMKEWEGCRNEVKGWKWRKDKYGRDVEGKEERPAGGNLMLIRAVFLSEQAGRSHHGRKMHLKWYQMGVWDRRDSSDTKMLEKTLKRDKSREEKRACSGNKHWQNFKEWHCTRGRFIWTKKCSERKKNHHNSNRWRTNEWREGTKRRVGTENKSLGLLPWSLSRDFSRSRLGPGAFEMKL